MITGPLFVNSQLSLLPDKHLALPTEAVEYWALNCSTLTAVCITLASTLALCTAAQGIERRQRSNMLEKCFSRQILRRYVAVMVARLGGARRVGVCTLQRGARCGNAFGDGFGDLTSLDVC